MRTAAVILGSLVALVVVVVLALVIAIVLMVQASPAPDFRGDVGELTARPTPLARLPRGPTIAVTEDEYWGGAICTIAGPSRNCRTVVQDAAHASWSPDGTRLAFERADSTIETGYDRPPDDIWTVNADGSHLRRLTHSPAEDHEPAWSPDGRRIAFVSKRDGDPEIYVMNADGSGQRRVIARPNWADRDAAWSPDGHTIVFASTWGAYDETQDNGQIVAMRADGTRPRRLTSGKWLDMEPAFSPDGTKIVFERRWQRSIITPFEIWVMNADGSHERRLTRGPLDEEPAWSPDGRWIAFERTADSDTLEWPETWLIRADGSGLRRVTESGMTDPAWRPVRRSAR